MYKSGDLEYGEEWIKDQFYLPHSCDEWVIGDLKHAKLLHKELGELIEKYEREQ